MPNSPPNNLPTLAPLVTNKLVNFVPNVLTGVGNSIESEPTTTLDEPYLSCLHQCSFP